MTFSLPPSSKVPGQRLALGGSSGWGRVGGSGFGLTQCSDLSPGVQIRNKPGYQLVGSSPTLLCRVLIKLDDISLETKSSRSECLEEAVSTLPLATLCWKTCREALLPTLEVPMHLSLAMSVLERQGGFWSGHFYFSLILVVIFYVVLSGLPALKSQGMEGGLVAQWKNI